MSNTSPSSLAGWIASRWLSWLCLWLTAATAAATCQLVNADGTIRPHKVLIMLGHGVLPLFYNWLHFHEKVCGGSAEAVASLELVCLDHSLHHTVRGMNCSRVYSSPVSATASNSSSRHFIWLRRMEVVVDLLAAGFDVIVSDLDALWVQSPYPDLNERLGRSKIISSQGNFPSQLSQLWGSTLCMGFLYAQAGDASLLQFLSLVLLHMRADENVADDQTSINLLLFDLDVRWHEPSTTAANDWRREKVGEVVVSSMDRSNEDKSSFRITLLSVSRYLRYCVPAVPRSLNASIDFTVVAQAMRSVLDDRLAHAVVAHCWLPTSSELKPFYLNAFSLWKASNESILWDRERAAATARISLLDCVFWEKILAPSRPKVEETANITERRMLFMKSRCRKLFLTRRPPPLDEQQRQRIRNTIKWPGGDKEIRHSFTFAAIKTDAHVARPEEANLNRTASGTS